MEGYIWKSYMGGCVCEYRGIDKSAFLCKKYMFCTHAQSMVCTASGNPGGRIIQRKEHRAHPPLQHAATPRNTRKPLVGYWRYMHKSAYVYTLSPRTLSPPSYTCAHSLAHTHSHTHTNSHTHTHTHTLTHSHTCRRGTWTGSEPREQRTAPRGDRSLCRRPTCSQCSQAHR